MRTRLCRWLLCFVTLPGLWTTQAMAQNVNVTGANAGNGSYATLQAAFAAINVAANNGSGPIAVSLVNSTTETSTAVLDNFTWASVTVTATTPVIVQGSITGAIIKLNGADNVTIDGRIAGSGRNITVQNNSTAASTAAIWLASVVAGNGATNNTLRNLELACGVTQNTATLATYGIIMSGTTISTSANGTDNDNNTFRDNRIIRARYGIVTRGTTTNLNESPQVLNNIIGSASFGPDQIGKVGIFMQADNNAIVSGNTVQNIGGDFANTSAGLDRVGIAIGQESWSMTPSTLTSSNYTVTGNTITNVIEERTFSAVGILLGTTGGGSATNNLVANNYINNVKSNGTGGDQSVGIGISGGHSDRVVYNTIRMAGDVDPNPSATATTNFGSGIRIGVASGTTHANLSLRNNIIFLDLSSSSTPTARYYAISGPSAAYSFGTGGENHNDYYINPLNTQCVTGGLGTTSGTTLTTQFATLANWQAAYTAAQDANSIQADPGFISTSDLHINLGSTTVNNVGTPIAGVTTDFDGDTRNGTNPDMGADEYSPVVCFGAAGGTITSNVINRCDGQTYTMTSTGAEVGAGINYQWEISLTGGGVGFANVSGGTGANTVSYTTGTLTPGVYYYRLRVDCSNGPVTGYSNELTLTVNANPSASIDVPVANYCNPNGVAVELNASGASNISWAPTAGLNTTTGATVSATPTANTTYTATVTDGNGCTATATSVITVQAGLTVSSITATPATVCSGNNSQLQVVAQVVGANTAAGTIYSAGTGSFETISSPNVLTVPTSGTADDGFEPVNTTGSFDFNYNGTNYDNFVISTNGYVVMGSSAPAGTGIVSSLTSTVLNGFNAVIGFGRDGNINVANGGSINHGLDPSGTKYVFEYFNFAMATGGAESATQLANFQIVLWGNASTSPGRIDLIYGTSVGAPATNAALGLRDASGTTAFKNALTGSSTIASTTATFPADQTMYSFERQTYTYVWTPSTFIAGQESLSNPVATGVTATTNYSVVVSSASGCSISSSVNVTVEPLSCSPATTSAATCENTNFSVTANHTGGGAPFSYSWDDGVGGVYPNSASITANLAAGTYTLTCTVSDACGSNCVSSTVVVVNPLPVVSVTPNAGLICNPGGSPIALSASGAVTYNWSPVSGLSSTTGDNVTANPAGTTTYTIVGTDANGCINTTTAAITIGRAILASASALPTSICEGDNAQLNVSVSPTPGSGAIKITEVTTFRAGTGATNPYPAYAVGSDLVEISNISASAVDISGYTLEDYANNSATVSHPGFSFPGGTILPPGSVAIVNLGTGTNDLVNRYFNTGGTNDTWLSTSVYGVVLKNSGIVIDAVGRGNPYVWNAGTGVTAADWTGNIATTSAAGIVRTAALDNNVGSDWVLTTITPASIGTFNNGYIPPVTIASYSWSPSSFIAGQESIQNPLATALTASTTYSVVVTTTDGCTATGNVFLSVTPLTSNTSTVSACDSYTWTVNGNNYTQSGTYTSVNGCHTEILDLTITPSTSNTTVASACDSYTWTVNGMMYNQSGTYTSVNGCHTEILDLTITPSTTNTTVASACDSYTWSVTGATYTQSGTYTPGAGLTVTISSSYWMDETSWVIKNSSNVVIASGGPYGGYGGTYVQNVNPSASDYPVTFEIETLGFYNDNEPNYSIVCNTNSSVLVSGTCVGTFWGGPGTFASGALSCPAAVGCVTEVLDLTITPSTSNTTVASACDSYTWSVDNMMYTQSGTYTSVNGCHTEILDLTITPSTSNTTVASACDSYTWTVNGMMYNQSGTYTSVNGCHTEILDMTITPTTTNTTVASACDSYTWSVNGMMYNQSGTYTSVNGCHTEILDLTITPSTSNTTVASACDSYTWTVNGMMYNQSGTYTSVNGCHTEILVLTLGQSTSSTMTASAPLSYTWSCNNVTYTQSGTYTCTGVNASGCPDVKTLILSIVGCNLNVTTANASGCPGAPIQLTGSPAGGTWSVANPYIGPSTTFTYTYTDPNTGCSATASGTISVANLAAVMITSVTVTGPLTATVNWTPVAGLGWYEVRYRPIGASSWTNGGTQAAPASFKNLVGLMPSTSYEIEVRGFCGINNPGPWGSNTVFATAGACGTPTGLFAAPVTGTTAKLNFVSVPGATFYQFRQRKVGVGGWTSAGTQAAPATSKTITGLLLNTQYEWQVRAVCNNKNGPWSSIDMFTTLASKQSVDFATETINNNVSVYPNPVRDVLTVEVTTEVAQNTVVKVFDMSGRLVKQIQANAEIGVNNIAVNLSDVSAGVYQVQVFANDKLTHISKISKQD